MAVMTMSMGGRLDEMQVHDDKSLDTAMALTEIRTQLQELTKSVESCQGEVTALSSMISYPVPSFPDSTDPFPAQITFFKNLLPSPLRAVFLEKARIVRATGACR